VTAYVRSGITNTSLVLLLDWISREFAKYDDNVMTVRLLRNSADLRSFNTVLENQVQLTDEAPVLGERNRKLVYPFVGVTIGSFEIDPFKVGLRPKISTNGQMIGKDKDKGEAYFESYIPIKLTVGASLTTDNLDHVLAYANMLAMARGRITLVMEADTGFKTHIGIAVDTNLTIPQADMSTPGDPFRFEHTFIIETYTGIEMKQRLIRSMTVTAKLGNGIDDSVYKLDDVPALVLQKLYFYELFDKANPNYKYNYPQGS